MVAIGILRHTHTRPWVCMGVRRCAQVCAGVRRCARVYACDTPACVRVCAQVCPRYAQVRARGRGGRARAFNLVGSLWHTKKTKFEKKEIPMPIL